MAQDLASSIHSICVDTYGEEIPQPRIEKTNPNFEGDLTLVVFPYLRYSKKSPEQTAEELGSIMLSKLEILQSFNVVKGFLNLVLKDAYWLEQLQNVLSNGIQIDPIGQGKTVVVEYSSPNTNKPLHLGHVRNNLLGFSYCQILEANGYKVIKNNLVNDRGIHICKSMLGWSRFGEQKTPESEGVKGDKFVGQYYVLFEKHLQEEIKQLLAEGMDEDEAKQSAPLVNEAREMLKKWESGDPETIALWKKMNSWVYSGFDKTYERMGVSFDKLYYESETYLLGKEAVLQGLADGIFYKKEDQSIWVDLEDEGLDHKLLLRADGTSVYITQDIGTADLKYQDFKMDQSIYVVGNEQDYHFKVLQLILKKLNRPHWEGIFHLSYGMVDLPSGRMKTREGTVVDADDLMDEMVETARKQTEELGKTEGMSENELVELYETLGLGALKYYLLKVDAKKRMLFNPEESIDFQGNTGPFVQYTYTRIQSILRAADSKEFQRIEQLEQEEKELIQLMLDYPAKVNEASEDHNPSVIANFVYELAKSYNRFYHQQSILGAKDESVKQFRIGLSEICGNHIQHACSLLGMSVPERM